MFIHLTLRWIVGNRARYSAHFDTKLRSIVFFFGSEKTSLF
ncbi:hypothetical protein T03_5153 [Trichinella britovi]|uniref:Uncharacterized protein n=1 Tax=Trichinella britovi TaxID=45882 RepID=A0A0V1AL72_TRIBR|nr:hypothetical protein T03_5153 [Trichinella britovi]